MAVFRTLLDSIGTQFYFYLSLYCINTIFQEIKFTLLLLFDALKKKINIYNLVKFEEQFKNKVFLYYLEAN